MLQQSHDQIARQFEKSTNIHYNPNKGVDFKGKGFAAEVVPTPETFGDAIAQLRPYGGRRYLVTSNDYIKEAIIRTLNTTIGVRRSNGTIVKQATPVRRKHKK